ncbi:MAG TPA: DUF4291 family protein [Cyclobacteriaceae bacterium]|nr:DUF4291 family protein [Cyclobacteriaceae bacterium]
MQNVSYTKLIDFSFSRMSRIKTGFVWMMHRSGWALKEGQEHVLRISLPIAVFDELLSSTVISSFSTGYFESTDQWSNALLTGESRLQWDPDHSPTGQPLSRKTIEQRERISVNEPASVSVPFERLYVPNDLK